MNDNNKEKEFLSRYVLTLGDIVKLKEPYRPEEWRYRQPKDWKGFEYGIVVEIVATQFTLNGDLYGNVQVPRNVSLHLYDAKGQLNITPQSLTSGLPIPEYVDFHISELTLFKIATETGYSPVKEPPDWGVILQQEMSILSEFGFGDPN